MKGRYAFIAIAVTMLLLPGQGLLTIVVGILLLEFPGKRVLETKLIRRPRIHHAIDALRRRFGHPPLEVP